MQRAALRELEKKMTEYDRYVMFCKREGFAEIMGRDEFNELMA